MALVASVIGKGMDFYLVRHGKEKSEEEDPARLLDDRGRGETSEWF